MEKVKIGDLSFRYWMDKDVWLVSSGGVPIGTIADEDLEDNFPEWKNESEEVLRKHIREVWGT